MTSRLSEKKIKIIVVDPSGPVRQMLSDVVRTTLGAEVVEGRPSVGDVVQLLEADPGCAQWILAPLMADQPVNGVHLLKLCAEVPELRGVRVSLLLEEAEAYVVPTAYELGMLSHHPKPFTKDTLSEELRKLHAALETYKFQEPLVAAHFLRGFLKQQKKHAVQLDLEKALLDMYPGNAQVLLNLAEPQFQLGKKKEAKLLLSQVKLVDPALADKVDEIAKAMLGPEEGRLTGAAGGESGMSVLGITSCIVIDPDETVGKAVEAALASLGVGEIKRFNSGEAAWEAIEKAPEPGLIIMEWRIGTVSGPLLVQRLRSHGFASVPVVVLSSLIKPPDMPLVREMSVANVISKPLNKDLFMPALVWTVQQERTPTEHAAVERKIRALLAQGKRDEADPLRAKFLSDASVPTAKKKLITAEWAFAQGNYAAARDAAVEALKHSSDSILVLNLLGKSFMCLRNFEAALKCFKKAQDLSPHNIERLCSIAETQVEMGDGKEARESLDHARTLDPDSKTVAEAEIKVAITGGNTEGAKKLMGSIGSLSGLVSYMNNKAIAHARCGFAAEAIELYRKTVDSVPDDHQDTKLIVRYNLALALARASELERAIEELDGVLLVKSSKVAKKAYSLRERLKSAVTKGQEFKLLGGDAQVPTQAPEGDSSVMSDAESSEVAVLAQVEAQRGDICCYLVFSNPDPRDARAEALLAKAPRFKRRDSIAREEAMGSEKTVKSAS